MEDDASNYWNSTTDSEGSPILRTESTEEEGNRSRGISKHIPLVFFCVFFYCGNIGGFTLFPQYLLYRLRLQENFTSRFGNETLNPCMINYSDPIYIEDQKIQKKSSEILSAASFAGGIPSLISVVIYGALSDRIGRKNIIYISYAGLAIYSVGQSLLINFNWSLYIYIGISFVNGCCGSHATMLAAIFAYIADVTTKRQRAVAIALIEGALGLSLVVTNVVMGYAIKLAGFGITMIVLSCIALISIFFLCCVRETVQPRPEISLPDESGSSQNGAICRLLKAPFANMKKLLEFDKRRSVCLLLIAASFTIYMLIFTSTSGTTTLYLMDKPFCWDSVGLGTFSGIKMATWMVGAFGIITAMRKRNASDYLILIGILSFTGSCILQGMSHNFEKPTCNIFIICSAVVGLATSVTPIMMRAAASKLVSAEEQGAAFGLISTGEAFSFSFGSTIASAIYAATLSYMKGFVFYFCGGMLLIAFTLMLVYKFVSRPLMVQQRHPKPLSEINS